MLTWLASAKNTYSQVGQGGMGVAGLCENMAKLSFPAGSAVSQNKFAMGFAQGECFYTFTEIQEFSL